MTTALKTRPRLVQTLIAAVLWLLVLALLPVSNAAARDLSAQADGEHLWLVTEDKTVSDKKDDDEAEPKLIIYHHHVDLKAGLASKLAPVTGKLMPGGIAAGDGGLLLVLDSRKVVLIKPEWNPLQMRWAHDTRALPALPEGCALEAVALGPTGPWLLVRAESDDFLKELEQNADASSTEEDKAALNLALGLPEDYDRDQGEEENKQGDKQDSDEAEEKPAGDKGDDLDDPAANPEPAPAAYRLLRLSGTRWAGVPLPEGFQTPRHAVLLLRDGDDRPILIVQHEGTANGSGLMQYFPITPIGGAEKAEDSIEPEEKPQEDGDAAGIAPAATQADTQWLARRLFSRPYRAGLWSAVLVDRQVVLLAERSRSPEQVVVSAFMLRDERALPIGDISVPTLAAARWAGFPWRGGVGVIARPGPTTIPQEGSKSEVLAGLSAMTLSGKPILNEDDDPDSALLVVHYAPQSRLHRNADLIIQITSFTLAMLLMVLYFRRVPRPEQLELPDHLVLGSFGRRLFAGVIDLLPGFWIAGLMYDTTINQTMLYWPGNGIPKALPAMRPGFIVITVTLVHTTLFEIFTARTPGKWFTGLYVLDVDGKPATLSASLNRSVARIFDLLAPLLLIFIFITPARQRLGDVLARTTVVMRKPRPITDEDLPNDDNR